MRKIQVPVKEVTPPSGPIIKPKRQITDAQREHLNKIRELAMAKKAQLKEITLKSKLAKSIPKQELANQYDEYVKSKPQVKKEESESESDEEIVKKVKTKPKKKVKKIVYESESESDEEVIVKKVKPKQPTLENLVFNNAKDQLYNRVIEERVRNTIIGYGNSLGV